METIETGNVHNSTTIRLTQFSHGAGCGCKLSPAVLDRVLMSEQHRSTFPSLIVGHDTKDDAAVLDIGGGRGLISTTDFFMPIVDDPFDFGRIASANALSDVYAMGGTPLMAIAILGWPVDKIAPEVAAEVLRGSRAICADAGIPLAGGHSIDSPEPIFGLAVSGEVELGNLKKNSTATAGSLLFLTKALGTGILSTAEKNERLHPQHRGIAAASMVRLNSIGKRLASIGGVRAMTDVTGFGLLGHCIELCEGSGVSARVFCKKLPQLVPLHSYISDGNTPGGTRRNWLSYGMKTSLGRGSNLREAFDKNDHILSILCDPQTSGGLLIAVSSDAVDELRSVMTEEGLEDFAEPIGEIIRKSEAAVEIDL